MDISTIALLFSYIVILAMAATVAALTIFYTVRLPSSKRAREAKLEVGQREEAKTEKKAKSRPVTKSSSEPSVHKQTPISDEKPLKPEPATNQAPPEAQEMGETTSSSVSLPSSKRTRPLKQKGSQGKESTHDKKAKSRPVTKSSSEPSVHKQTPISDEKPLKPEPATKQAPPEAQEIGKATSPKKTGPWSTIKKFTFLKRKKTEAQKQVQPKETAPAESSEPTAALKEDSITYIPIPITPQEQLATTEPEREEELTHESSQGSIGPSGEKIDSTHVVEPVPTIKEVEASIDTEPGIEIAQESSGPVAATADSGKADQEMPQAQKSSTEDLDKPTQIKRRRGLWSILKNTIFIRRKQSDERKQVQPKETAPAENSEPTSALKDDSMTHIPLPIAPQEQLTKTEPERERKLAHEPRPVSTGPSGEKSDSMRVAEPAPMIKEGEASIDTEYSIKIAQKSPEPVAATADPGKADQEMPQGQKSSTDDSAEPIQIIKEDGVSMDTRPDIKIAQESPEPAAVTNDSAKADQQMPQGQKSITEDLAEPTQTIKDDEAGMMDTGPGIEIDQESPEPASATTDSDEDDQEMPQTEKSSMGDLAELFAKSTFEDTETGKLAEEMNDIDANELLREGLGLLSKCKNFDGKNLT